MTIKEAIIKFSNILESQGFTNPSLDIEVLLCHVLNCDRVDLINNSDYELTLDQHNKFLELFLRRQAHEPIAYIINKKEFCSYDFFINKNVLIPRPLTEELVDLVFNDIIKNNNNKINIIDVGTGSGAIIISIFNKLKRSENIDIKKYNFYASDVSNKALDVAKINAKQYGAIDYIKFLQGNLRFPKGIKFNYIIANLPYLDKKEIDFNKDESKDLLYEPKNALFTRGNGIYIIRKFLNKVKNHVDKDGLIYLEIGNGQLPKIKQYCSNSFNIESFYEDRIVKIDLKSKR